MAGIHRSRNWVGDARALQMQVRSGRRQTILIDRKTELKKDADRDRPSDGLDTRTPDVISFMTTIARSGRCFALDPCSSHPATGVASFQGNCT